MSEHQRAEIARRTIFWWLLLNTPSGLMALAAGTNIVTLAIVGLFFLL